MIEEYSGGKKGRAQEKQVEKGFIERKMRRGWIELTFIKYQPCPRLCAS